MSKINLSINYSSKISVFIRQNAQKGTFITEENWVILSSIEQLIREKIEQKGVPLKDWDIKINYGIKTGLNDAFIINEKKKEELIQKDPKSAEIIRPILRGRDVRRYSFEFADLYIIATFPSRKYSIDKYPAVKEHLLSFGYDRLKQTGDTGSRKKTNNQWFETQDSISYWEDFYRPKIIYPGIMRLAKSNLENFPRFCLDEKENFFFGNDCYFIVGNNLVYLWLILNSTLIGYMFRYYIYSFDENGFKIFTDYFQNIPIPYPSDKTLKEAEKIAQSPLDIKAINKWVYSIFDLTPDEITEIEKL